MRTPALLGGDAAFPERLPLARPARPPLDRVVARYQPAYESGILTNGRLVKELEEAVAARLGVPHVVAVSSCTSGLILVARHLASGGPAVLPSFTFAASAHAVAWAGLAPRFVECDPDRFQIDLADAAANLDGAALLVATHVFGAPCRPSEVEALAAPAGVPVLFDAAHGLGATSGGRPLGGFGAAEVFSLTPTKIVVGGEGGLVATSREDVATAVRLGRDYANPGDYDSRFVGLNARLPEFNAAMALESLLELDAHLARRRSLAGQYVEAFRDVPGVRVQAVDASDESTFKDFTIRIDPDVYGLTIPLLKQGLDADGIDTRRYFHPAVHRHQAYAGLPPRPLPVTEAVADTVLSLPLWRDMPDDAVARVASVVADLHHHAGDVRRSAAA